MEKHREEAPVGYRWLYTTKIRLKMVQSCMQKTSVRKHFVFLLLTDKLWGWEANVSLPYFSY